MTKKSTRRQFLGATAAVVAIPVVAQAKKLPCGLKEIPLPVCKFDKDGNLTNVNELLDGVAFKISEHMSSWGNREARVWVNESDAVPTSYFVKLHGEMTLLQSFDLNNMIFSWHLEKNNKTQRTRIQQYGNVQMTKQEFESVTSTHDPHISHSEIPYR